MQDFNVTFRYAIQRECTLEWRVKGSHQLQQSCVHIKGKSIV